MKKCLPSLSSGSYHFPTLSPPLLHLPVTAHSSQPASSCHHSVLSYIQCKVSLLSPRMLHSLFSRFFFCDEFCLKNSLMPTCSPPSATATSEDTIILSPPTTLTVQEGEAVTVPCVASGAQQPVFMFGGSDLPMGAQSNQYSLDFATITPESNGSHSCQVGSTTSTFSINVLRRLHRMMPSHFLSLSLPLLPSFPVTPLFFSSRLPLSFLSLSLLFLYSPCKNGYTKLFCHSESGRSSSCAYFMKSSSSTAALTHC